MCCLIFRKNVTIHTQERISTDFEIPVSMRQRNIRVGIHLSLRQDMFRRSRVSGVKASYCARHLQCINSWLGVDSATARQCLPASSDSETRNNRHDRRQVPNLRAHLLPTALVLARSTLECEIWLSRAENGTSKTLIGTSSCPFEKKKRSGDTGCEVNRRPACAYIS